MNYDARDRSPDGARQPSVRDDIDPPGITLALIELHKARARQMQAETIHRSVYGAMTACARMLRRRSPTTAGRRYGRLAGRRG